MGESTLSVNLLIENLRQGNGGLFIDPHGDNADPIVKLIPGMSQTPETAAHRYLQASEFGTDVSGHFFASAPRKLTGPIEAMRQPHFHDPCSDPFAFDCIGNSFHAVRYSHHRTGIFRHGWTF